jgi:hypothetical protein
MSIEGLITGFVLFGAVVLLAALPLLRRDPTFDHDTARLARQRERAQVYYERVLRNIRDLDEDHALGKLDDGDYQLERQLWAERGVQALRLLEQLQAGTMIVPASSDDTTIDRSLDEAVEAAIAAYREKRSP